MKWEKEIQADDNQQILIEHVTVETVEDSYDEGEIGGRMQMLSEPVGKIANSSDELVRQLARTYGLSSNKSDYYTINDNILGYSRMVDENGSEVSTTGSTWEEFKIGKVRLWSEETMIKILLIKTQEPTTEDMVQMGFMEI